MVRDTKAENFTNFGTPP